MRFAAAHTEISRQHSPIDYRWQAEAGQTDLRVPAEACLSLSRCVFLRSACRYAIAGFRWADTRAECEYPCQGSTWREAPAALLLPSWQIRLAPAFGCRDRIRSRRCGRAAHGPADFPRRAIPNRGPRCESR